MVTEAPDQVAPNPVFNKDLAVLVAADDTCGDERCSEGAALASVEVTSVAVRSGTG
jgi:hypothetical protein